MENFLKVKEQKNKQYANLKSKKHHHQKIRG